MASKVILDIRTKLKNSKPVLLQDKEALYSEESIASLGATKVSGNLDAE